MSLISMGRTCLLSLPLFLYACASGDQQQSEYDESDIGEEIGDEEEYGGNVNNEDSANNDYDGGQSADEEYDQGDFNQGNNGNLDEGGEGEDAIEGQENWDNQSADEPETYGDENDIFANEQAVDQQAEAYGESGDFEENEAKQNGGESLNNATNPFDGGEPDYSAEPVREQPAGESYAMEVFPELRVLNWVGYEHDAEKKTLTITMICDGAVNYELFQEQNRAEQPELVVRFPGTRLRPKIRRDMDASEFRSPVAYVRMREDEANAHVDVVLTLRDRVQPEFYASEKKVVLVYKIPKHYFGNQEKQEEQPEAIATDLDLVSILPSAMREGEAPLRGTPEGILPEAHTRSNEEMMHGQSVAGNLTPDQSGQIKADGLPPDFDHTDGHAVPVADSPESSGDSPLPEEEGGTGPDPVEPLEEDPELDLLENARHYDLLAVAQQGEDDFSDIDEVENSLNQVEANTEFNNLQGEQADFQNDPGLTNQASGNAGNGEMFNQQAVDNQFQYDGAEYQQQAPLQNNEVIGQNTGNLPPDNTYQNTGGFDEAGEIEDLEGSEHTTGTMQEFSGKAISIEFHDTPLNLVLKTFSEESGNNFVTNATISDIKISIFLKNVPWDEALKAILEAHGLGMVRVGASVVRIDEISKITDYMKQLEGARLAEKLLVPSRIMVMRLTHATAKAMRDQLVTHLEADTSADPRIKFTPDERTNSIVVEGPEEVLAKVRNVIERLDLETPQVEIASRIAEVTKTTREFFGVRWINNLNLDPARGLGTGGLNFPNSVQSGFAVDPGVAGNTGTMGIRLGSISRFFDLDLLLGMEERKGTTNILQQNRVTVIDRQEAVIFSGESRFFRPVAGGNVVVAGGGVGAPAAGAEGGAENNLDEVEFNLELKVTPEIAKDGVVNMDLEITSDTPGDNTEGAVANRNRRQLRTRMSRQSGETTVIGGIYDNKKQELEVGVPFFSSIPIIGALFRSSTMDERQTELLVMITPRILNPGSGSGAQSNAAGNEYENVSNSNTQAAANFGGYENAGGNQGYQQQAVNQEGGENQQAPNSVQQDAGGQYQNQGQGNNYQGEEAQGQNSEYAGEQGDENFNDQGDQGQGADEEEYE